MRAFIAVEIPNSVHQALANAQARFREAAIGPRWTPPDGFHLTLKFLGQVPEERVHAIREKLAPLGKFEGFGVEVRGFGFFPNARGPRVLWAGVHAPPALAQLAARVDDAMAALGFEREARDFHPHLTLARFKIPRPQTALERLLAEASQDTLGSFEVSEFFLWESKLSPGGASYRQVERFPKSPAA
jgi:2'-5' RNA ligase